MKLRAIFLTLIAFWASVFLAVSCTPSQISPSSPSTSLSPAASPLRLGFSAWPGYFPWQVAQEENLFEANGIQVDLKWFYSYLDSVKALQEGQVDATSTTLIDVVVSLASGTDGIVPLIYDYSTGNDQVIVRAGIENIAQLKGKKLQQN